MCCLQPCVRTNQHIDSFHRTKKHLSRVVHLIHPQKQRAHLEILDLQLGQKPARPSLFLQWVNSPPVNQQPTEIIPNMHRGPAAPHHDWFDLYLCYFCWSIAGSSGSWWKQFCSRKSWVIIVGLLLSSLTHCSTSHRGEAPPFSPAADRLLRRCPRLSLLQ